MSHTEQTLIEQYIACQVQLPLSEGLAFHAGHRSGDSNNRQSADDLIETSIGCGHRRKPRRQARWRDVLDSRPDKIEENPIICSPRDVEGEDNHFQAEEQTGIGGCTGDIKTGAL